MYPDIEFVHSNFEDYVKKVQAEAGEKLSTVKGEADQPGDRRLVYAGQYLFLPCNLKRRTAETRLHWSCVSEPLAVFAAENGKEYPHDRFNYAWKILMQNHPHDSICGCSVDQVNKEIEVRFDRSTEVAHTLSEGCFLLMLQT